MITNTDWPSHERGLMTVNMFEQVWISWTTRDWQSQNLEVVRTALFVLTPLFVLTALLIGTAQVDMAAGYDGVYVHSPIITDR